MSTVKQRLAVKEITENHLPVSKAMLKVGYDSDTASKPSNLTKSKGFKELIAQLGVSDEDLAEILSGGLRANKVVTSPTEPDKEYPDWATRHKYLETGLRLRGYAKEEAPNFNINFINQVPRPNGRINTKSEAEQETGSVLEQ